jgi:hypothetical protein
LITTVTQQAANECLLTVIEEGYLGNPKHLTIKLDLSLRIKSEALQLIQNRRAAESGMLLDTVT